MLISQPLEGRRERERDAERNKREVKNKRRKWKMQEPKKKRENEFFKKARPGVEREMKMNERCEGRIECEHSSVLSFKGVSESFLLRCSAFVIKFSPRLSQLHPIDSLSLPFCLSPVFLCLLPLQPSSASGTLFLVLLWNVICGEVWGCKEQLCACVACVFMHLHVCGYRVCACVYMYNMYKYGFVPINSD